MIRSKNSCPFFLLLVCMMSPGSLTGSRVAVAAEPITSTAVAIESAGFLKVPPALDPSAFTMAATAPRVDVAFFAGLDDRGPGTLWTTWGDGCLASNGKYYTSVGDHLGTDAASYLYEYDSASATLRRVVDVA